MSVNLLGLTVRANQWGIEPPVSQQELLDILKEGAHSHVILEKHFVLIENLIDLPWPEIKICLLKHGFSRDEIKKLWQNIEKVMGCSVWR